jgi:feruloyl esterase
MTRCHSFWISVGLLAALVARDAVAGEAQPGAGGSPADRCSQLLTMSGTLLGEGSARIVAAHLNAASPPQPPAPGTPPWIGGLPAMPEHCEAVGVLRERTGVNGQHYAVRFHLRLPSAWNGRFLMQGGGGTNGEIGAATGMSQLGGTTALGQGYAVVSTDTGHDNRSNFDPARQGVVAFGHDYAARVEYAERALDSVATAGKAVVSAYYGKGAHHSYFTGCSNGGREGMVFAQRYPEQFDGILASAPAFAVPRAAIAEANDTQAFAAAARERGFITDGLPDLGRSFSDPDLQKVGQAISQACDALDGIADGMVQEFRKCTAARVKPLLTALLCKAGKEDSCLTSGQVQALLRSLAGPVNARGQPLYADWPWDPGIASPLWRLWKIGLGGQAPINVELGSPALSGLFMTPPQDIPADRRANLQFQLQFDFDRDASTIYATTSAFPRSGWDLVGAQSTNLRAFSRHGGKMIVPHGTADPIFSINDTVRWWEAVDKSSGRKAAGFVRVFPVPGMNHCAGGPATDQFDALGPLVDWVEKGIAPQSIPATAGPTTPFPGRTRPLCPYPSTARYVKGDSENAASFVCAVR